MRGEADIIFEPDPASVLEALIPRFVEMTVYRAMLELAASEQSARMVAMRAATENATELIEGLRLAYNKLRQSRNYQRDHRHCLRRQCAGGRLGRRGVIRWLKAVSSRS